jgi:urease accessory protein
VRAHAHVVAEKASDGSTLLRRLCGGGPLTLRPTGTKQAARIHLVAGAFGPLGGDELRLRVTLEPGTALEMAALAATLVLPSRTGEPSSMQILLEVADGARLLMAMPVTVLASGACHTTEVRADLAPDAELHFREETVRGRSGEAGGDITAHTTIDVGAAPVLRQTIAFDEPVGGPWSPRTFGSLLHLPAGPQPTAIEGPDESGVSAAWLALPRGAGHQFSVLADDPMMLRRTLDRAQCQLPR